MLRRIRHAYDGGEFSGIEFGDPVQKVSALFIHATGFNAMTYQSLLAPLGLRARLVAMDMRGHGRSTMPARTNIASWKHYRDDVIKWIETHAPQGLVLSGHSMGGCVALLVAGKRPDLVKGLVLVDPVILSPRLYRFNHLVPFSRLFMRRQKMAQTARRRRADYASIAEAKASYEGRGAFATWREPFLDDYLLDGFDRSDQNAYDSQEQTWSLLCKPAMEAATFAAQRNRPWGALRKVKKARMPLIVLRPEKGAVLADNEARRLLHKYPDAIVKTIRGTTHFLPMEAPYAVRDEISAMVSLLIEGFAMGDEGPVRRSLLGRKS